MSVGVVVIEHAEGYDAYLTNLIFRHNKATDEHKKSAESQKHRAENSDHQL